MGMEQVHIFVFSSTCHLGRTKIIYSILQSTELEAENHKQMDITHLMEYIMILVKELNLENGSFKILLHTL